MAGSMKKKVLIGAAAVLIALIGAGVFVWFYSGRDVLRYNNTDSKDDLITRQYTSEEIQDIQYNISIGGMTFAELDNLYEVECLRKTHQGYYVVLRQDDGKDVYLFLNDEMKIARTHILGNYKTKEAFADNIKVGMSRSEVYKYDSNDVSPFYGITFMKIHIVQEGYYKIRYSRPLGADLSEPTVEAIEYCSNEEILAQDDPTTLYYILEIDRVN